MKDQKTTLLILVDAFRWDYVNAEDTPFLWELANKNIYVKKLKPGFGFCERSEIFAGSRSDRTNNFTAIGYNPLESPFRNLRGLASFLNNRFFDNKFFRQIFSLLLRLFKVRFSIFQIPYHLLPFLSLTEDLYDFKDEMAFGGDSILARMSEKGMTCFYDSFTALGMFNGSDDDRIEKLIKAMGLEKDLYLLFIGEADHIGHFYGGNSFECKNMRRRIDEKIRRAVSSFDAHFNELNLVILGDHGMVDVSTHFSAWDEIKRAGNEGGFVLGKDYLVFLDSTMVRFWFFNELAKEGFIKMLNSEVFRANGKIITGDMAQEYHIPVPSSLYGDLVWWANSGVVIFPDYFHRTQKMKGMHGYDPSLDESKGFCIVRRGDTLHCIVEEGQLVDICPTLADLLGVLPPKSNQGKSFITE